MSTVFHRKVLLVTILMVALGSLSGFDQVRADGINIGYGVAPMGLVQHPAVVQFVGSFYAPEQKEKVSGMNMLTLVVKKKEWLFKIKDVIDVTGNMTQSDILNQILPSRLTLRGPNNLIDLFQKSDIEGKQFSIRGNLYFPVRVFIVESVHEVDK